MTSGSGSSHSSSLSFPPFASFFAFTNTSISSNLPAFLILTLSTHLNAVNNVHFVSFGISSNSTSFTFRRARVLPTNSLSEDKSILHTVPVRQLFITNTLFFFSSLQNTSFPNNSVFKLFKSSPYTPE